MVATLCTNVNKRMNLGDELRVIYLYSFNMNFFLNMLSIKHTFSSCTCAEKYEENKKRIANFIPLRTE